GLPRHHPRRRGAPRARVVAEPCALDRSHRFSRRGPRPPCPGGQDSVIREQLISCLATGFFAPQGLDRARAGYLLDGRLKLGDQVVKVDETGTYDGKVELPRNQLLLLHSLRWLDMLRRSRGEVPGAEQAWTRLFEVWSNSDAAANPESVAWGALPLEQRSIAIALGAPDGSSALASIPRHLEMLEKSEKEAAPAARRLQVLRIRLGLQARRGDTDEELRETAVRTAEEVF